VQIELTFISKPVPASSADVCAASTRLAGHVPTGVITISGGEPLLHPNSIAINASIRKERGTSPGIITNGYLCTADRIESAKPPTGLEYLQTASTT